MNGPVLAVHGGAGGHTEDLREHTTEIHAALASALTAGADALGRRNGDAVEAVRAAVMVLEAFPLFNAGYGSALCSDGSVELSASVMRGSDRAAGGVAMMTRTAHPVAAAVALLDEPEVLLVGACADDHAAANGLEQRAPAEFVTERQRQNLADRMTGGPETVGAVCLDTTGLLAAATSTGGLSGQRPGRVGDSPLIGAGTWADHGVAISCTGQGEAFIRAGAARLVAALVEHGHALETAAQEALEAVAECGGNGGLIAVDAHGSVTTPRSTAAMPRGVWRPGQNPVTAVP
ncbi:MAG TPA: isoaspartyl peptidase/L-asparaginase [Solirubrobacteraceae bacterium]|nr:isoaspartyl peptidase/L-asparaginase [Solirubrobacteraceae bacterium]